MPATIAASAVRTCLGAGAETFAALLRGTVGAGPLRHGDAAALNVAAGHHVSSGVAGDPGVAFRASAMLARCVTDAVRDAGVDATAPGARVVVLVGTGLGELAAVEEHALGATAPAARRLHFGDVVRAAVPGVVDVITLTGACSAGGHALALAQDMIDLGDADAVVVGATDSMTTSMLAMIGRVAAEPTARVRPFDRGRTGVLLGEGAAAIVVVPPGWRGPGAARLLATGLSCDARHPTAPDPDGIRRAMEDAYRRAGRRPEEVDLVVAHGTGTALNDPAECAALTAVVRDAGGDPLVTGVKGAVGHTSGAAALINVDVAVRCLRDGVVPPVTGLRNVLDEGAELRLVRGDAVRSPLSLVQCNAFGFGGVNAVTLVGRS